MDQMVFWEISWTDEDFEYKVTSALCQIDKLRRGIFARYTADQRKLEELDGIVEELISFRADRSQAVGEL